MIQQDLSKGSNLVTSPYLIGKQQSILDLNFLLDEHGSDVLGFLVASVGPHDAEDCFQETFIAALRTYPRLEHGRNLRSWLLTIADHVLI